MRILFVSPGFPPDRTGGIENYVKTIYNEMSRRGHKTEVLTQYYRRQIKDPHIHQIKTPPGEATGYAQWALKGWARSILTDCDVIHFNGFPAQIVSLTPLPGVPKVVHVHNSLTMERGYYQREARRHKLGYMLASRSYRRASVVISPTLVVKNDLVSHVKGIDPDKIKIIPNCIDTEYYRPNGFRNEIREKYALQDKFVILYFGKIKATKGVETLCKAFKILKKDVDAALIIGGASAATNTFSNYLKTTYKDVIFTGFVDDPRKYYGAADAFSIYTDGFNGGEVFPIALLEAMSMGLPVVCTENPIFREITRGNAFFGEPDSPEALARCLLRLAKNPEAVTDMGRRNRQLAQSAYDSRKVADRVEETYCEILQ
jgi:glycosyltransferase involved in cell wall biosynthesis